MPKPFFLTLTQARLPVRASWTLTSTLASGAPVTVTSFTERSVEVSRYRTYGWDTVDTGVLDGLINVLISVSNAKHVIPVNLMLAANRKFRLSEWIEVRLGEQDLVDQLSA